MEAMETTNSFWKTALWGQFGAAIDMLDNALVACPASLWRERLWSASPDNSQPPHGEYWYIAYHTLYWLDVYLSSVADSPAGVNPPSPFQAPSLDADDERPRQPYAKEDLLAYLAYIRRKCQSTIETMTSEGARSSYEFPWKKGQGRPFSYLELLMYTMRHVQEHVAQLSLCLGQHGIPDADLDWVPQARDKEG